MGAVGRIGGALSAAFASAIKHLVILSVVVFGIGWLGRKYGDASVPLDRGIMNHRGVTGGAGSPAPLIFSHRGSRTLFPENTIGAHKAALEVGSDVMELDVYRTSDGHLIVAHDSTALRTCGKDVKWVDMTLEEVKALDAGAMYTPDGGRTYPLRGKGQTVPTLSELMDALPEARMLVEIKDNDQRVAELLRQELVGREDSRYRVGLGSRHCEVLRVARRLTAHRHFSSACETEGLLHVVFSQLGLLHTFYYFSPPEFEALMVPRRSGGIALDQEGLIKEARGLGMFVVYWVINAAETASTLLDRGASGLITDRPDIIKRVYLQHTNGSHGQGAEAPVGLQAVEAAAKGGLPADRKVELPGGQFVYMPTKDIEEVHTCITPSCLLLQASGGSPVLLMAPVVFGVIFLASFLANLIRGPSDAPSPTRRKPSTPKQAQRKHKAL